MPASRSLFDRDLPLGFDYRENFITDADERVLLEAIADVVFSAYEHHIPPVAQMRYSITFRTLR